VFVPIGLDRGFDYYTKRATTTTSKCYYFSATMYVTRLLCIGMLTPKEVRIRHFIGNFQAAICRDNFEFEELVDSKAVFILKKLI
jgi:hypothetical protein